MEIDNLKHDDTVQCIFFSSSCEVDWKQLCNELNETVGIISRDYIWHRDEFNIRQPLMTKDTDLPQHLISTTCFGDNVEDEWFIAYLIFKLTQVHKNLIVQIQDNDGDFLLIEAADYLPCWANPETTQNRVFIYNSNVHLIPPTVADLKRPLKLNDALKLIIKHTEDTKASLEIEQAILKRIGAYPDQIKELSHRATVTIPVDLAALLILKPALISHLINAYCNHDDFDIKSCSQIKFDNCVDISVQLTKFQYAMLLHTNTKLIHRLKNKKIFANNKKCVNGFKLTFGFEIIMNESRKDLFSSKEYNKFLKSLAKNEYFKGNMEGSKEYKRLLEKANEYFMEMECPVSSYICGNITQLLSSHDFCLIKESLTENNSLYLHEEDSDDWLNVDPNQLDDLLNKNYTKKVCSNDLITPSIVTSELNKFLSQTSDFEGVEEKENLYIKDHTIEFDSNEFFKTVENMLNMVTIDKSEGESSGLSEDEFQNDLPTEEQIDEELEREIIGDQRCHLKDNKSIVSNLVNSMKEEGLSGPSSNVLRSIGINKLDLRDSDDDIE